MLKRKVTKILYLTASITLLFTGILIISNMSNVNQTFDSNTKTMSLMALSSNFSAMNCEVSNDIAVDVGGIKKTMATANERVNPLIDTLYLSKLSLQVDSKNIDNMYFQLWLLCDGSVFANGKSTVVAYGTMDLNVRGTTVTGKEYYFYGGQSFAGTSYTKFTLPNTAVKDDVRVLIGEIKIPKATLDQKLGFDTFSGSKTSYFKSTMIPTLKWDVVHPSIPTKFTAQYDFKNTNEKIISQYTFSGIGNFKVIDSDGDTIPDSSDQCPTQKETVNNYLDTDGCPDTNPIGKDTDGDGITDDVDQCPTQKETVNNYLDTDGCPDVTQGGGGIIDKDGDTIPDSSDQCPTQKETVNGYLDTDGCPDLITDPQDPQDPIYKDTDNDGVDDEFDQCLNLPETFNGYLDTDGCPDQSPTTTKELAITDWTPKIIDRTRLVNPTITEYIGLAVENYAKSEGGMTGHIYNSKGTQVDSFNVPDVCLKDNPNGGFLTCEFAHELVMSKYPVEQYTLKITSPSRPDQKPSVTIDIIATDFDKPIDIIDPDTDNDIDYNPDTPSPELVDNIIKKLITYEGFADLITNSENSGGVIISKSTKFGLIDAIIILALSGVTVLILLLARYMKKKRF